MLNPSVLIVDDDPALREIVSAVLDREGYEILLAENGQEALSRAHEASPTVILLDLTMPVMDGIEFLSEIKLKPDDPYAVIMLTGYADDDKVKACYDAGVSGFLKKPFNIHELKGAVKSAIAVKQFGNYAVERGYEHTAELARVNAQLQKEIAKHDEAVGRLRETNEELIGSRRRLVNSLEELRSEIADRLHGPVQNRLLAATHWLRLAQQVFRSDPGKGAELVGKAVDLVEEVNEIELRAITRQLHPSLIRFNLLGSIRSLANSFNPELKVCITVDENIAGQEDSLHTRLPEEIRLASYRVVEEALNNVRKHALATKVDLGLGLSAEGRFTVTIRDEGRGFDVETTLLGLGLHSMRDYCGAVGGELQIQSYWGEGTTISAAFPLPKQDLVVR